LGVGKKGENKNIPQKIEFGKNNQIFIEDIFVASYHCFAVQKQMNKSEKTKVRSE
jgi:hypothetical protein